MQPINYLKNIRRSYAYNFPSLCRITATVKNAEGDFFIPLEKHCAETGDWGLLRPMGPRSPLYESSSPVLLFKYFNKLNLDSALPFVDLGSGFGTACFTAALYFKTVTGIEFDPKFLLASEGLRRQLKFDNVTFKWGDFMGLPLDRYRVFYFYWPFAKDFEDSMAEKLKELSPGSIVIAPLLFGRDSPFKAEFFSPLGKNDPRTDCFVSFVKIK